MTSARSAAEALERELQTLGAPARAVQEKAYLKTELEHLGVAMPELRRTLRHFLKEHPSLDRKELLALAAELWRKPIYERRALAALLLEARQELLGPEHLTFLEGLIREAKTWALVDVLAPSVAGPIVERHSQAAKTLDRWAADPDFWVRRAALLALMLPLRRGEGDFSRFARYAEAMMEEKEFFIRKAIGWVLREVAYRRPEMTAAFMRKQAPRASGVTLREALRNLPDRESKAILTLAKAKIGLPARRRFAAKVGRKARS